MGNYAVVNYTKINSEKNSVIASDRIAKYVVEKTGAHLIDDAQSCFPKVYDVIFIVNGISLFCRYREELETLIKMNNKFVWIGNDYQSDMLPYSNIAPHLRKNDYTVVAAYENFRKNKNYFYVNWNALTFFPGREKKHWIYDGLSYYGAFRKGRQFYFEKYFNPFVNYKINISAGGGKAQKKFEEICPNANFFKLNDVIEEIGLYRCTLYIEDESSHKKYCSPANRFYECLSGGNYILFDRSCLRTFKTAGLDVSPWVVDDPRNVRAKIEDENLRELQRKLLYEEQNYFKQTETQFENFLSNYL